MKIDELIKRMEPTILLAILTAISYSIAYSYKLGYLNYFGVPSELVEANVKDLAQELIIITVFLGLIFLMINNTEFIISHKNIMVVSIFLLIFLLIFLPFLNFLVGDDAFNNSMIIILVLVISSYFTLKKEKYFLSFGIVFITLLFFAVLIGLNMASKDTEFVILDINNQQYVLISTYKGKGVIAPVNLNKNLVTPTFQIINLESKPKSPIILKVVQTKHLKIADD